MADQPFSKASMRWQLRFEGAWVTTVAFLGSARRIAAGNRRGQIVVWDLPAPGSDAPPQPNEAEKKEKKDSDAPEAPDATPTVLFEGHTNAITRLAVTPDNKCLVSTSLDRTVRLWDLSAQPTGEAQIVMDPESRERRAKRARTEDREGILNAPGVKVKSQQAAHVLDAHKDWINSLGLSRDGKRMITGDDKCHVIVWDFVTREPIAQWDGYSIDWISSAALSPDGKVAFVGEYCASRGDFDRPAAQARLFKADDGSELVDILKVQFPDVKQRDNSYGYNQTWGKFVKRGFVAAQFAPDGKMLAVAQGGETDTGQAHLLDPETGKVIRTVSGHQYGMTDLMFTADGKHLITVGRDTTVRVCQVSDGKEIAKLGKPRGGQFKDWLHAVCLSPDEKMLAAADMAGLVNVWEQTA